MNKILISCSIIVAAAALLFAAEETTKSSTSSTEHQVMKPSDLKWGDAPPGSVRRSAEREDAVR